MKRIALDIQRRDSRHRGSILLMVLVAIILMTLTTSTYLLLMRNEHLAARYSGNHLQTEMLTQSGIDYLRVFLAQTTNEIEQQGGLLDNPEMMQDVLVIDEELANYRGRFTVVAPDMEQGYYLNIRYGLENESAKLNLNALLDDSTDSEDTTTSTGDNGEDSGEETEEETLSPSERLLLIPGMNEEVVDAILDWLDEDDTPRDFGAESDFYLGLTSAYQPTNGPLAHLDELLMIQGVTPELLYGVDANQNYQVEADEQPRGALQELDNTRGELDRGWSAYLTVHSLEKNVTPEGEEKIDLNAEDLQTLHGELVQALGTAEANFIIAYRQYGPAGETATGEATSAESAQIDFEKEGETSIESLLELIGASVSIETEEDDEENESDDEDDDEEDTDEDEDSENDSENDDENQAAQLIASPWQDEAATYNQGFADLLDVATVDSGKRIAGRININLASLPVLLTIPGMTETLADQILASRLSENDMAGGDQRHPTWLIAEGLVTLDELRPMFPWITTGGDVYSGQVVGYFDAGTARSRAEIVLDRSGTQEDKPARLLSWKDLSKLGPGFSRTALSTLVEPDE